MYTAAILAAGVSAASADIAFNLGNNPFDSDNVLFNDDSLSHAGTLVQGNFSGQGSGFIVDFTSSSGNNMIEAPSGGQARVAGQEGNDPISQLTFGLEDNATFTGVVFNAFSGSGTATVTVTEADGNIAMFQYELGNGENFLTIIASNGQQIDTVSLSTTGDFTDLRQVRIGGFERAAQGVPDGGLTAMLLGLSLSGLAVARKRLA